MKWSLWITRKHLALEPFVIFFIFVFEFKSNKEGSNDENGDKNSELKSEFVAFIVWREDNFWRWKHIEILFFMHKINGIHFFPMAKQTISKPVGFHHLFALFLAKTFLHLENVQLRDKSGVFRIAWVQGSLSVSPSYLKTKINTCQLIQDKS